MKRHSQPKNEMDRALHLIDSYHVIAKMGVHSVTSLVCFQSASTGLVL